MAMECELVRLAGVPMGLVTSALFYTTTNKPGSRQADFEGPSEQAREVQIAICPTGRLMAFIASYKAQFVASNDSLYVRGSGDDGSISSYQTTYEGLLKVVRDPNTPRPVATAVIIVPVTLETRTDTSSIILVGFTDGCIRAYSKMGVTLFSQSLHGEPVVAIHCMAPSGGSGGPSKINVSVLVVFPSLVCVVEGWSVCEAVGHAVGARDRWEAEEEEEEEVPLISYRKWRLGDQRGTTDAALLAPSIPCLYDYLCEAGNVGGYDIMIRGGPAPQSQLIVVGESPMIALYRISKDSGTVNVSEVVSAVASKMTRSVLGKLSQAGGWLGWGGGGGGTTPPSKLKPQEKKMVMNLQMSTNIPDERRTVTSISVSPLGNLSVCVDGFGRILLLDNHAMTIRRMWKGYRDAQTGWVLVHDTTLSSQSSTSHHHKKRRKTSEKLPSSSSSSSSENQKRAQCLCVYLPRRGLVELWPVQNGSRIAVFQVGKGCRLLSAPHGILTASKPGDVSAAMTGRVCGLQHTTLLLCPNGQLLSFIIPFPTLVRLNDSSSYDAHLLQKLSPTLQEGDESGLLQIIASLKTVQSLKEAVEGVMYAYPITSLPRQSPALIVEKALKRTNRTDQVLCTYLRGVRQLFRLYVHLSQIGSVKSATTPSSTPSNLPQLLTEMCGLAGDAVVEVTKSLEQYASCKPAKLHIHVVRTLSLKELMKCFDLAVKMGRGELTGEEGKEKDVREGERDVPSETMGPACQDEIVPLSLKKNTNESTLFDLSFALFHGILTQDVAEKTLHTILVNCGISFSTLQTMLCRVFLSGRVTMTSDPAHLLHRLYMIVHVIVPDCTRDGEEIEGAMADIRRQCSHTHNVGHALIMVLICHRLVSARNTDIEHVSDIDNEEWGEGDWGSDGGGVSGWDTVTEEGEQWVRLQHRLEVLTQLCGTVGLTVMSKTPPLPYMIQPRDTLTVKLMNDDVSSEGISMMLLETVGPWLIAHCIAYWLVTNKPPSPPKTITATTLQADHPSSVQDTEHADILNGLVPLVKLFQYTLSSSSLLVHCAWQAAYLWTKEPSKHQELNEYILQCISLIPESRILAGVCLFLWHSLFEPKFVESLGHLKKGTQQSSGSHECVSLSRHLFGYLHQLGDGIRNKGEEGGGKDGETRLCDVISIPLPSGVEFMMDVIPSLPIPSSSLIQTYLSLLLHTELALLLSSTHNVISFYPSWVRMVIKKGLLSRQDGKDDGSRQHTPVATQLQQKRVKFLCEAITHFLDSSSPKLRPSIPSIAIHHHSQPSPTTQSGSRLEVTEFTSGLFLLAELWCIDVDVVRRHYVTCLFAAGLGERGKEALQSVKDKSRAALDLLSLAGCLTDILLQQIGSKPERLALTAQLPPTQLEWIRKQTASGVLESCPRVSPTWSSLSLLLTLIQPHLPPPSTTSPPSTQQSSTSTAATIAYSLAKISSLQTS